MTRGEPNRRRRLWVLAIAISMLGVFAMARMNGAPPPLPGSEVPRDANGRYRNTGPHDEHGFRQLVRWVRERRRVEVPEIEFPAVADAATHLSAGDEAATATWVGHSTFLLQLEGRRILTDPHFTERASPVSFAGPARTTPPPFGIEALPPIDAIVISHNHYDHLDRGTVRALLARQPENPPLLVVPQGLGRLMRRWGATRVVELEWWRETTLHGLTFTAVPVQHFSARTPFDRNETLWAGWIISDERRRIFFAGDTGYSGDFRAIRHRLGAVDLALIPIGAYEPRWFMRSMHVNPEEAVQIHLDLEARTSIGMHWGTFVLTDEPMTEPLERLATARRAAGVASDRFVVFRHGETRALEWASSGGALTHGG